MGRPRESFAQHIPPIWPEMAWLEPQHHEPASTRLELFGHVRHPRYAHKNYRRREVGGVKKGKNVRTHPTRCCFCHRFSTWQTYNQRPFCFLHVLVGSAHHSTKASPSR